MEYSASVEGFPQGLSKLKVKLFIEQHIGPGLVANVTKEDDLALVQFQGNEGLQKFYQAKIEGIPFGGSVHKLTILKQKNQGDGANQARTQFTSSIVTPRQAPENKHGKADHQQKEESLLSHLTQENLYSQVRHWCDLPTLPAPANTICVLAQNIGPTNHIQKVITHFELRKRSGGGPVKFVVQLIDGLLIVFNNEEDCKSCLQMTDQTFGDVKLSIFEKVVPEYYRKKFVLTGVKDTTEKDTVEMYLESCSKNESTPIACARQVLPGVIMIEYGDNFDESETGDLVHRINTTTLEEKKIMSFPLLKTDCLKISGVTTNVSDDAIRLVFINTKRTNGGPVTKVSRLKNDSALVYFASYTVAERVYQKFLHPSSEQLKISGHPVKVQLYHHSLSNDHIENVDSNFQQTATVIKKEPFPEAKHEPRPFLFTPNCDTAILSFVFSSKTHTERCKKAFEDVAKFQIRSEQDFQIEFTPSKVSSKKSGLSFSTTCEEILSNFLSAYTKVSHTFERSKLQRARSYDLYPEIEKNYRRNPNNDDVTIYWKTDEPVVSIIGLKTAVDEMTMKIENRVNSVVITTPSNKNQFRILLNCGIVEELRIKYPNVSITCDERNYSLILQGLESEVHRLQLDSLTLLSDVDKKVVTGLDDEVIAFISKFLSDQSDFEAKMHQNFKSCGVKGVLILDGDEPYLRVKTNKDYKKAIDAIKQFLAVEEIKTDEADFTVLKSTSWKHFAQNLSVGMYNLQVKPNGSIMLTGSREQLKLLRVKIKKLLDENSVRRIYEPMGYGFARFVVEYSDNFSKGACAKKQITCGLTREYGGGVFFEGKKHVLDSAVSIAQGLNKSIQEYQKCFDDPGVENYYTSQEGLNFIKMTERMSKCVILLSQDCDEWVRYNEKHKKIHPNSRVITVDSTSVDFKESQIGSFIFSSVELSVWKTDIIKHECDVIVNASNPELQLLGGLSGAIRELDSKNDNVIQKEMDSIIQKNYGSLLQGDAAITSSGNLPMCKKIIHAVGPKWESRSGGDPKLFLKACVSKSLKLVDQAGLKSIAIPAISCGIFGGSVSVCIPLILEAVFDYLKEEQNTRIKKIHFVDRDRNEVIDAFMGHFNEKFPNVSQSMSSTTQQSQCKVELRIGDIVSSQADVIVNATTLQSLTNMANGSVVAKALAARAGANVQQQCSQIPPPHKVGHVYETDGGSLSCKKLYHALVEDYNPKKTKSSKAIIDSIVLRCLTMANNAGFDSIVFPALATGGFSHPPQLVAKWMRQEILKFSGQNLKTVVIVLYPNNNSVIGAFNAEFKSTSAAWGPSSGNPVPKKTIKKPKDIQHTKIDKKSAKLGPLTVCVYKSDITSEQSDVIVNSTNGSFDLSQGMVSQRILQQGGLKIQDEALNGSEKDFRVTSGGKLPCKKIIHLVTPTEPKDLQRKIVQVLQEAEMLQLFSISLPALGTGNLGLDAETVGAIMRDSIEKFIMSMEEIEYLDTINIVIWKDNQLKPFKDSILNKNPKKGIFAKFLDFGKENLPGWITGISPDTMKNIEDPTFKLFFYSTCEENIQEAIKYISNEVGKQITKLVVRDELIRQLTKWEIHEITELQKRLGVKITNETDRYLAQLEVVGLTKHAMEAQNGIKDILRHFLAAQECAVYVKWQKMTNGTWDYYTVRSGLVLEKAYKEFTKTNTSDSSTVQVPEFAAGAVTYHQVDFVNMTDDTSSQIRRLVHETADDLPPSWDKMNAGTSLIHINLLNTSTEYQDVLQKFQSSGVFSTSIISIERIQSISLYKQYAAKKTEVAAKLKNFGKPFERQLFHGTDVEDKIIDQGFDRSFAGKNATVYGRGVYFATTANYSHRYATVKNGQRSMFLADVLTGDYCTGNQGYVSPPVKPNSTMRNDIYDSVVDNQMNPSIFVIFKDASAYPAYLITYT